MLPAVGSRLILRSGGRRVIPPPGRGAACARGLQPPKVLQGFDPVSPRQDHRHAAPVLYGLGDVAVPFREQCQLSMRGDKGWVQGKRGSVRPPSLFEAPLGGKQLAQNTWPPGRRGFPSLRPLEVYRCEFVPPRPLLIPPESHLGPARVGKAVRCLREPVAGPLPFLQARCGHGRLPEYILFPGPEGNGTLVLAQCFVQSTP